MGRLVARDRKLMFPAAMICSTLANLLANREEHPAAFTIGDFLPGEQTSEQREEQEWAEFIDKVQSGEDFAPQPPEVMQAFGSKLVSTFGEAKK